mmetsp:Transcript_26543/g.38464  ORF Transcript_26543/g.38464 Transcript_26543/m.38464 type:complete len:102 (-) Transcript_26543:3455-3760(-)
MLKLHATVITALNYQISFVHRSEMMPKIGTCQAKILVERMIMIQSIGLVLNLVADDKNLATSAAFNNGNIDDYVRVRVYQWDEPSNWTKKGHGILLEMVWV